MIDLSTFAVFAAACVALAATPGPDMLLIVSRSASQGSAAGFASLAGIQVGTYCHALAAAVGLAQLLVAVPIAFDAVRYAGAAYLLFLAWQAYCATGSFATAANARSYGLAAMFRQGLATNLLNPKMALFVLALLPQFVQPEAGSIVAQFMVLATVLNVIGLIVNGAIILAAGRMRRIVSINGRWHRLSQIFLGTVFAGLAVRLAFDGRK